jgi:hypothetical protein
MRAFLACALIIMGIAPIRSQAIELHPSAEQIATALERGVAAATARTPPVELYSWFGPPRDDANEFRPRGFLMTKLSGLAVLSAHFALRAQQPNEQEIRRLLDDQHLQVSVTLYGDRRDFAQNTFIMLVQGDRKVMPVRIRADDTADRTSAWPKSPAYRAKVVASFAYGDFDPLSKTQLSVFPRTGGELTFDLDFAAIP